MADTTRPGQDGSGGLPDAARGPTPSTVRPPAPAPAAARPTPPPAGEAGPALAIVRAFAPENLPLTAAVINTLLSHMEAKGRSRALPSDVAALRETLVQLGTIESAIGGQ